MLPPKSGIWVPHQELSIAISRLLSHWDLGVTTVSKTIHNFLTLFKLLFLDSIFAELSKSLSSNLPYECVCVCVCVCVCISVGHEYLEMITLYFSDVPIPHIFCYFQGKMEASYAMIPLLGVFFGQLCKEKMRLLPVPFIYLFF